MNVNFTQVEGEREDHEVVLLTLSTCGHCNEAKNLLRNLRIAFEYIDVDRSSREEKREITQFLRARNLPLSFPVIIIDEDIISGYREREIWSTLRKD